MRSPLAPRALLPWDPTLHIRKSHSSFEWSGTETLQAPGMFNGSLHPFLSLENAAGSPLTPTALVGTTWSTILVGHRDQGKPGWSVEEVKGPGRFCKSISAVIPLSHLEMLPSCSAPSCNSIQIYDLVLGKVLLLPDWNDGQLTNPQLFILFIQCLVGVFFYMYM